MQVAFLGGIPRDGRRRAPSMLWVLKRLSSHARSEWMRWRPTTGGRCDIRSSSERSPRMGLALALHRPLDRPLRPPTTSCARARSDVPAPGRNPPPANSERREETAASRFNGSPPQAETQVHLLQLKDTGRRAPDGGARSSDGLTVKPDLSSRVRAGPGGVHRPATQRPPGTPPCPGPRRGRTNWPATATVVVSIGRASARPSDARCRRWGGGTRRPPSAPYPGGDAPRAWPARRASAASCPSHTTRRSR